LNIPHKKTVYIIGLLGFVAPLCGTKLPNKRRPLMRIKPHLKRWQKQCDDIEHFFAAEYAITSQYDSTSPNKKLTLVKEQELTRVLKRAIIEKHKKVKTFWTFNTYQAGEYPYCWYQQKIKSGLKTLKRISKKLPQHHQDLHKRLRSTTTKLQSIEEYLYLFDDQIASEKRSLRTPIVPIIGIGLKFLI